jgi:hypothetical protein
MMPSRVVDGDALWKSKKLRTVPDDFKGEYANLIPLADTDGILEYDPHVIYSTVYVAADRKCRAKTCACGREVPFVPWTPQMVEDMFAHFESTNMLERYEADGKTYATFVNIDKRGRLPSQSEREKYGHKYPPPPSRNEKMQENLPLDSILRAKCKAEFGEVEAAKFYKHDLRNANDRLGYQGVQDAFNNWLQAGYVGKYPLGAFLKSLVFEPPVRDVPILDTSGAAPSQTVPVNLKLQFVEDAISARGEVFFSPAQKAVLIGAINLYGAEAVVAAFNDFYSHLPSDKVQYAAHDFANQVNARVRAQEKKRLHRESVEREAAAGAKRSEEQVQRELDAIEAAEAEIPEEL